jgi:hypothetical protein
VRGKRDYGAAGSVYTIGKTVQRRSLKPGRGYWAKETLEGLQRETSWGGRARNTILASGREGCIVTFEMSDAHPVHHPLNSWDET